jgi:hypothetical protein
MIEYLILIFFLGILVKLTDFIVDEKIDVKYIDNLLGFFYGLLAAFIVLNAQIFSSMFFAVIIAVAITKKIDKVPHIVGALTFFIIISLFGLTKIDIIQIIIFIFAAVLDEIASSISGKKSGVLAKFFSFRPFLEISVFLFSIITGLWILFFGVFIFDTGYNISRFLLNRIYKLKVVE